MRGYSYTTISKHPGQEAYIDVALYLDEHAQIRQYGGHVRVEHGDVELIISVLREGEALAAGVAKVRELAEILSRYATEMEAHAKQNAKEAAA